MAPAGDEPKNRLSTVQTVYLLAGGVAVVAVLATTAASHIAGSATLPVHALALLVAFAIFERYPIHLEYRREAQSFTLSTIPLVVGLFAVDPVTLVAVRVIGAIIGHGRLGQDRHKLAVNVSAFLLDASIAALVFHSIANADPLSGWSWLAAVAAASTSDLAQVALISSAIRIFTGSFDRAQIVPTLLGNLAAVVDACLALAVVVLIHAKPSAVLLLAVVPVMLFVSYGAYTRLREKHQALELLYAFTRSMSRALVEGNVTDALLRATRELMHAETAWVVLPGEERDECQLLNSDDKVSHVPLGPNNAYSAVHHEVTAKDSGLFLDGRRAEALSAGLGEAHSQILAAPLTGAGRSVGTLCVADRSGSVRPFNDEDLRLFSTLAHQAGIALENGDLIEQLRHEARVNEHLSLHDPLTGLPNRVLFHRTLSEALEVYERVAVLLLDLDGFKEVNDTLGHQSGDLLLQQVGNRLRDSLRRNDTVARLGGDEFAVLVTDLPDLDTANEVAAGLKRTLEAPFHVNELELAVGAAIGIAMAPDHSDDAEVLLQRADVAMYNAKADHTGVEMYHRDRDRHSPERLALVADLKGAVNEDALDLHYQPQIDLATGEVIGVEALARWVHPVHGYVPPIEFVAMAEHTGLISRLTRWVLDRALGQLADWQAAGLDLRMAVNLSARNLLDPDLVEDLRDLLNQHGVPANRLCLEITETCAMADPQRTSVMLHRLADLGVRLAVDDFGTGYSSLTYLRTLPVNEVKIDRSFVMHLADDPDNDAIVQSIVALGQNLRLEVIAEGVEDPVALERLAAMGCHGGQGYYICRPNPAHRIDLWLVERRKELIVPDDAHHADHGSEPAGAIVVPLPRRRSG